MAGSLDRQRNPLLPLEKLGLRPERAFTKKASHRKNNLPMPWPAGRNAQAQSANGAHGESFCCPRRKSWPRAMDLSLSTATRSWIYERWSKPASDGNPGRNWRAIEQGDPGRDRGAGGDAPMSPSHLHSAAQGQENTSNDR